MSYNFCLTVSETADFRRLLFSSFWVEDTKNMRNSPFFSWKSWFCSELYTRDTDLPSGEWNFLKNKDYSIINTLKRWEEYIYIYIIKYAKLRSCRNKRIITDNFKSLLQYTEMSFLSLNFKSNLWNKTFFCFSKCDIFLDSNLH